MSWRFLTYVTPENVEPVPMYRNGEMFACPLDVLVDEGCPVPPTPTHPTWRTLVFSRKRCGFCWAEIDGTLSSLQRHVTRTHPSLKVSQCA